MGAVPVELHLPDSLPQDSIVSRFSNLRGVQWRINLGILPSSPSASIDELRRVAADCRRRYASLRRRLLIDPHIPKDGSKSPDLSMDNPLSQNPDSTWGRFFRNAELEKLVDKDLSRLYPEDETYFQTPACQALLRRILLVWCLRHPEYGYRQGMHELLAPLVYVLHVDIQRLSQVRSLYEDCFSDEFDEMNFPEGDMAPNYRFKKSSSGNSRTDSDNFQEEGNVKVTTLDDLDPETKELFLLSDAYGAEGELGVILSERFMEHDAFCMFDGLMSRAHGVVAMADFFSPSPAIGSSTSLPPVIEASAALYHVLSIVDSSLHTHLIELGVEPQYFALRWLRVLFGREFSLDNLLLIWDELFSSSNVSCVENERECSFKILCSSRGAFIAAMAVSMLLHLRSSLLATENATSCLQRLLNFPKNVQVQKLIEKAKSWQVLALEANISSSFSQNSLKLEVGRVQKSLPNKAGLPRTPNQTVPESYWEEKWRVLHKELSSQKNGGDSISHGKIKKLLGNKFGLARTGSDPSPAKKDSRSSTIRRRLLDDLNDVNDNLVSNSVAEVVNGNESPPLEASGEKPLLEEATDQSLIEDNCLSEENSSFFSRATSPRSMENDHDNDSEKSTASSNSFAAGNDEEVNQVEEIEDVASASTSTNNGNNTNNDNSTNEVGPSNDGGTKQGVGLKDRKLLSGKFPWFLKLGRGSSEANSEKGASNVENVCEQIAGSSSCDDNSCGEGGRIEVGDKKVMGTLKNLGHSMLENIQVIESAFQQDRGKGQAAALAALKELRKISNLLSDM